MEGRTNTVIAFCVSWKHDSTSLRTAYIERKSSTLENGGTHASYGFRIRRAASSISPVIQDINGVDASLERDFKGLRQRSSSLPAFHLRGGAVVPQEGEEG